MAQYTRTTTVDSGPSADTVKQAVLDVDTDLTGSIAAYNAHDTATTGVHGSTGTATGTGAMVRATSPTLVTPNLGTPSAVVLTNATGTVTSLTLVTPALGTPASGTLTNCTGLPAAGVVGTAIVASGALGTPASGTLTNCTGLPTGGVTMAATAKILGRASAGGGVAEEIATTGTGSVVLETSPTLVTPALGTPASGNLANCTNIFAVASQAQAEAGTADTVAITPLSANWHPGMAKVLLTTTGAATPTIETSWNVTSITDDGTGLLTVTIATDFSSTTYTVVISTVMATANGRIAFILTTSFAAGSFQINCVTSPATAPDAAGYHLACFGDQ